mgnify:CR=1 FL=1|jgi:hypothetical protein
MAYSKQNWADGQTITAAKLNAMDDAIFEASASIPTVKLDGNILRGVSNKPLNVTMSGEGAFPKKLLASGQNLVKMPTSGSGTVRGLTYEFTPNGLNVHGTAEADNGAVVELAPLLTDNGICLPDGFRLHINKKLPTGCSIAIWDDAYVVSHSGPTQGANIDATGGLTHVAFWVSAAGAVDIDDLQIAIVYGENGSYEYTNGTGEVCDTGVDGAFTGDDSATVTVPGFENDGDTIILLTDSETQPTFSTEIIGGFSSVIAMLEASNPLWGKHYHACGDSFTAGSYVTDIDKATGEPLTTNYLVAKYNNMKFTKDAIGGSDMTNVGDASNPFSVDRYLNIPEDTDYLTLQFGLNEIDIASEPSTLGTSADSTNTTMWGAYNTVLQWILTNRPNAKVGVIISDSWMTETYANALIDICKFWGVPWLDLGGDPQVSLNIGGRRGGSGITLSETAKSLRDNQFKISSGNAHPNGAANRWRYTALQEFLRRL